MMPPNANTRSPVPVSASLSLSLPLLSSGFLMLNRNPMKSVWMASDYQVERSASMCPTRRPRQPRCVNRRPIRTKCHEFAFPLSLSFRPIRLSHLAFRSLSLSLSLSVFVRFYLLLIAVIIIIIIIIGIQYSLFLDLRKYYLISVDLIDRVDQNY